LSKTKQTKFLVRIQTDRLAKDGFSKVSTEMKSAAVKGRHRIQVQDLKGHISVVDLDIQFEQILVHPPIGKKDRVEAQSLSQNSQIWLPGRRIKTSHR
jgi:hypothetical protein